MRAVGRSRIADQVLRTNIARQGRFGDSLPTWAGKSAIAGQLIPLVLLEASRSKAQYLFRYVLLSH